LREEGSVRFAAWASTGSLLQIHLSGRQGGVACQCRQAWNGRYANKGAVAPR